MIEAFPLCWPIDWKRTKYPQRSRFDTTFAVARDAVVHELRLMGGKQVIISSNVPLKRDGLPYANIKVDDTGIAVYFTYDGIQMVLACDKWNRVEDNMQAIRKTISSLRMIPEWGVSDMLKRAFTGFKALEEKNDKRSWEEILGVPRGATTSEIKDAYRKQVMQHHPDKGGDAETFHKIQKAYEEGISVA